MLELTRPGLRRPQLLVKRLCDILLASTALILTAPLWAVIALAIRATSRGPILFAQERVGLHARRFRMYKFRSMVVDAEARLEALRAQSLYGDGRLFKLPDDPRITPVGRLLRRTSLDELPQLLNVLLGEMSLVGPRPPVPAEVARYEEHHYTRFDMKPGITGPWQVGGRNAITDFEEVVRLEVGYMRQWTLWKDVMILLRTIPVVFGMRGAH
jgi:lipopolysaccharide/colanic/teichoic acid biosynthesis glycosyltransferase